VSTVYTVGHSNKGSDELAALLVEAGIETIVDVRSRPYSRWNPQFNRETLKATLEVAGIGYDYRGKNLGGLDGNVHFHETIDELVRRAGSDERLAVMCSEGSHLKCHRHSDLEPAFLRAGADVAHLQWTGKLVTVHAEPLTPLPMNDGLFDDAEIEHVHDRGRVWTP
jgi:uncharacterized protein (DUF488 family)